MEDVFPANHIMCTARHPSYLISGIFFFSRWKLRIRFFSRLPSLSPRNIIIPPSSPTPIPKFYVTRSLLPRENSRVRSKDLASPSFPSLFPSDAGIHQAAHWNRYHRASIGHRVFISACCVLRNLLPRDEKEKRCETSWVAWQINHTHFMSHRRY